jgi:hypothetical protein
VYRSNYRYKNKAWVLEFWLENWNFPTTFGIVHLVYENGNVMHCVEILTDEESIVCLNIPSAYECRKYVGNRI